jgi:type VI secretion system secreted protein VgrG
MSVLNTAIDMAGAALGALSSSIFTLRIQGETKPLRVVSVEGEERIGELYDLEALIEGQLFADLPDDAEGRRATLVFLAGGAPTFLHGVITGIEFEDEGKSQSYARVRIQPSLYALAHNQDSRIFQFKTVPQIIERVLLDAGISPDEFTWVRLLWNG